MGKNDKNLKKGAGEYKFAMPFEEIDGGDKLHSDLNVSEVVLAKSRAALRFLSMGEAQYKIEMRGSVGTKIVQT